MCINIFASDNRAKLLTSNNKIEENKTNKLNTTESKVTSKLPIDNFASTVKIHIKQNKDLPWYFLGGSILGNQTNSRGLYPEELTTSGRIIEQLNYINPEAFNKTVKKILMWNGLVSWSGVDIGQTEFLKQKCPVNNCDIVTDRTEANSADLIIFKDHFYSRPPSPRPKNQLWMIYMLGMYILVFLNFPNFVNNL